MTRVDLMPWPSKWHRTRSPPGHHRWTEMYTEQRMVHRCGYKCQKCGANVLTADRHRPPTEGCPR